MSVVYADSEGFLSLQGAPPESPRMPEELAVVKLTPVPPIKSMLDFHAFLNSLLVFKGVALSNPNVRLLDTKESLRGEGTGILLGSQHAPNGLTPERLKQLFDAGLRVIALTYNGQGEYVNEQGRLTEKGRQAVGNINDCGMALDVSHASQRAANELLDVLSGLRYFVPPMASHSGCYEVHPHERNLRDDVMRMLHVMGGYIGIPAMNFMTGGDDLKAFASHVRYAVNLVGKDCIGIGSDCPHIDLTMEHAREQYDKMAEMLKGNVPKDVTYPDRPRVLIEHGSSLFAHFANALQGLPAVTLGFNFVRYLNWVLP